MIIEFTDIHGTLVGTVAYTGGRLVGSTPGLQAMVEEWTERGKTEREFLDKHRDWSNGYLWSELKTQ